MPELLLKLDMWEYLPDELLEGVLFNLSWYDRLQCALVCRRWYAVFCSPCLWRRLCVTDSMFTRSRAYLYQGYRQEISHRRVQSYLDQMGNCVRHIVIMPNNNYFNLYGFIHVLYSFLEFFDDYPMPQLRSLRFTFACENQTPLGVRVSGTGGSILEGLVRLLRAISGLHALAFNQLLLAPQHVHDVIDQLQGKNRNSLRYLELVNYTDHPLPLYPASMFPGLRTLVISPLNLSADVLRLLTEQTCLRRLVLFTDHYSPTTNSDSASSVTVPRSAWVAVRATRPQLRVRLAFSGRDNRQVELQDGAPVDQVVYASPMVDIDPGLLQSLTDDYKESLTVLAYHELPATHGLRHFHDRADLALVLLIRQCRNLRSLVINQRLSSSTLLLLAADAPPALRRLCVRRNAVLLKNDWPSAPDWSDEFCAWLSRSARDYSTTEREVAKKLTVPWKMLSDEEFKNLDPGITNT